MIGEIMMDGPDQCKLVRDFGVSWEKLAHLDARNVRLDGPQDAPELRRGLRLHVVALQLGHATRQPDENHSLLPFLSARCFRDGFCPHEIAHSHAQETEGTYFQKATPRERTRAAQNVGLKIRSHETASITAKFRILYRRLPKSKTLPGVRRRPWGLAIPI